MHPNNAESDAQTTKTKSNTTIALNSSQQSVTASTAMGVGMEEKLSAEQTKEKLKPTPESSHTSILLSDGNLLSDETDIDGISLSMLEDFSSSDTPCTSSSEKYSENATNSEESAKAEKFSISPRKSMGEEESFVAPEVTEEAHILSATKDGLTENVALGNILENHEHSDLTAGENNQCASVPPPFSVFVDYSRLCLECKDSWQAGSDQDLNQQRELQSLLPVAERKRLKKRLRRACWPVNGHIRQNIWKLLCETFHRFQGASVFIELEKEMFGGL